MSPCRIPRNRRSRGSRRLVARPTMAGLARTAHRERRGVAAIPCRSAHSLCPRATRPPASTGTRLAVVRCPVRRRHPPALWGRSALERSLARHGVRRRHRRSAALAHSAPPVPPAPPARRWARDHGPRAGHQSLRRADRAAQVSSTGRIRLANCPACRLRGHPCHPRHRRRPGHSAPRPPSIRKRFSATHGARQMCAT